MSTTSADITAFPSFTMSGISSNDAQDRLRLQAALAQISRLEREFQDFRKHAGAQLASALDENRQLRNRLDEFQKHHQQQAPASGNISTGVIPPRADTNKENLAPIKMNRTEKIKPSERMLSVEEMRKRQVTRKSMARRSLRPVRGFNPQNNRKGNDGPEMRKFDGERREADGWDGALGHGKRKMGTGGSVSVGSSNGGGRRGSLLPRSFSRKWSGCF